MAARGTPFKGVLYAGLMLTRRRPEADRVQRPLRRSGMPGADDAAEVRPAAGADRDLRRRARDVRPALARRRGADRGHGRQRLSGDAEEGHRDQGARARRSRSTASRCSTPARGATATGSSPTAAACSTSPRAARTIAEARARAYAAVDRDRLARRVLPQGHRLARDGAGERPRLTTDRYRAQWPGVREPCRSGSSDAFEITRIRIVIACHPRPRQLPPRSRSSRGSAWRSRKPPTTTRSSPTTSVRDDRSRARQADVCRMASRTTGEILVTHFRPQGNGPFPVVVINHGRSAERRAEPRQRYVGFARMLVRRGFAVLVLTRVGYGELGRCGDPEVSGSCASADYRPAVAAMAEQTAAVVRNSPRARLGSIASESCWSADPYGGFGDDRGGRTRLPGVIGGINFAGGLGGNPKQRPGRALPGRAHRRHRAEAGAKPKTPMLWLYSENDKYWGADWPRRWHEAFAKAGGKAKFVSCHRSAKMATRSSEPRRLHAVAAGARRLPGGARLQAAAASAGAGVRLCQNGGVEQGSPIAEPARKDGYGSS